jgi:hypothetical protein
MNSGMPKMPKIQKMPKISGATPTLAHMRRIQPTRRLYTVLMSAFLAFMALLAFLAFP